MNSTGWMAQEHHLFSAIMTPTMELTVVLTALTRTYTALVASYFSILGLRFIA